MKKPTLLRMREGKPGGNKGPLLSEDVSLTLTGVQDTLFQPIPIQADAARAESEAKTPSPDAEGKVRLRDPGLGIGEPGDPMFTLQATSPHIVASVTPASSQESEAWTSDSNEPDGAPSVSARSTPTPAPSSPSDGPEFRTSETYSIYPESGQGADLAATLVNVAPPIAATDGERTTDWGIRVVTGPMQPSGPAASLAKIYPSQASDEAWAKEPAADSPTPSSTLWSDTDLPSSSWRTSLDSSPVMAGETWRDSSVRWSNSGMAWRTGLSTLATSESRNAADGSSSSECECVMTTLTDVLLPTAPPRYSLSARAAAGILRRASKRGRALPEQLHQALTTLAASSPLTQPTPSRQRQEAQNETTSPSSWTVRRLTPTECERLMGWPDGHTIVTGWKRRAGS